MTQFSFLNFYKLTNQWYNRDEESKHRAFSDLATYLANFKNCQTYIYLTHYFRNDTDFLLWNISETIEQVKIFERRFRKLELYKYLSLPYKYFSITKESKYLKEHKHQGQTNDDRTKIDVIGKKYLFVYPFTKKREWYKLPEEVRFSMMKEHFTIGHKYPNIKIHTTYCYGLHDYEFILIFESDSIEQFLELVEELRFSQASQYTLIDIPIFTCEKITPIELVKEFT
ncbi:MAG: chlorite dismutase family protein [Planctomycetota bacterium]